MRWFVDPLSKSFGNVRVIKTFIWFPRCCIDKKTGLKQIRWLERCKIRQKVVAYDTELGRKYEWKDLEWVDECYK